MGKSLVIVGRNLQPGGSERVISQLANHFSEKGIKVSIITMDFEDTFFEINESVALFMIGKRSNNRLIDKICRYTILRKTVKSIAPQVVLSLPEDIGIYVIGALIGTRIPVFVSERNNPWIMPNVTITRLLRRLLYPFAKGIIFQTEIAKSFFPNSIQMKGVVIDNPVDILRIPEKYCGKRNNTVVSVGRLAAQKNYALLLDAFAEFSKDTDYQLVIYGEGPERRALEERAKSLGISDKVFLPGSCSDVLSLIRNCAMFILTSDYEGMPNVLLEAMCMGMPVISSDCPSGGPRKLIVNEKNGLLFPIKNKEKLVENMFKMCNIELSERLADEAYKIRGDYTNDTVFDKWENYLFG